MKWEVGKGRNESVWQQVPREVGSRKNGRDVSRWHQMKWAVGRVGSSPFPRLGSGAGTDDASLCSWAVSSVGIRAVEKTETGMYASQTNLAAPMPAPPVPGMRHLEKESSARKPRSSSRP